MSKAILISIKPKYVADILNGKKPLEIRKTMPKCKLPIDVYIYCTKNGGLLFKEQSTNTYYAEDENKSYRPNYALNGKVLAKFTLNKVEEIEIINDQENNNWWHWETETLSMYKVNKLSCLTGKELLDYLNGKNGYAWHIDNLEIFDKPKELSEFKTRHYPQYAGFVKNKTHYALVPLTKAPQSYVFIEV